MQVKGHEGTRSTIQEILKISSGIRDQETDSFLRLFKTKSSSGMLSTFLPIQYGKSCGQI
jgi:hypothetical protein